jgi:nicotinamidase-related amidase
VTLFGDQTGADQASWRGLIPDDDWTVYEAAGYGRGSIDCERPALLVIDVTYGFVGEPGLELLASIEKYPNSCGASAHAAVPVIVQVLDAARKRGVPVFYTGGLSEEKPAHVGRWAEKHARFLEGPPNTEDIVVELERRPNEVVIRKTKPSAFFGTPLISLLVESGVDGLIITGCTTSGCVRATVIDAFSFGFQTIVVEDGVFDRSQLAHAVNLFDVQQKYAHVCTGATVVRYLQQGS